VEENVIFFAITSILVGAPLDAAPQPGGAAYLYTALFGIQLAQSFAAPTPTSGDLFGSAVALALSGSDLLVVIGASAGGREVPVSGNAFLFDGAGVLRATLASGSPTPGDLFGAAVAASPTLIAVGAPLDDTGAEDAGAVYLFDSGGRLLRKLQKPSPAAGDLFGSAVAIDGTRIVVGALRDDTGGVDAGAVYLFDGDPTSASFGALQRTLESPTPSANGGFGAALALDDNLVIVGAPYEDPVVEGVMVEDAGQVHLFDLDGSDPIVPRSLLARVPRSFDHFGAAVAASGITLVVGAPGSDEQGTDAGIAEVFSATCGDCTVNPGEECDDGNLAAGDGCSPACRTEPDFLCSPRCQVEPEILCNAEPDVCSKCRRACAAQPLFDGASSASDPSATGIVASAAGTGICCLTNDDCGRCLTCNHTDPDPAVLGSCVDVPPPCPPPGNPCDIGPGRCDPERGCVYDEKSCDDANPCTADSCDVTSGQCVHPAIDCKCNNNAGCQDGNDCNGIQDCVACSYCFFLPERYRKRCATRAGSVPKEGAACTAGNVTAVPGTCHDFRCVATPTTTTSSSTSVSTSSSTSTTTTSMAPPGDPCAGSRVPKKMTATFDQAEGWIAKAQVARRKHARKRFVARALGQLQTTGQALRKARTRGKLAGSCADSWRGAILDARARARAALHQVASP
jgi:cysteine-rich repeat protein